jgi:hypothetical protein
MDPWLEKCFERHDRVGFDNTFAENAGHPAVNIMHDKPRRPNVCTTFLNNWSTAAGSLASQAYRRTPCMLSSFSRTGFSGFLAATATCMPFFANSLAQLELMPGPPPTMSATS